MAARRTRRGGAAATFYVVGAGRVGLGLARALAAHGWELTGVYDRSARGRARATRFLRRRADASLESPALARASLVLVAVSDGAVAPVGRMLAPAPLARGTVVAHTSGVLAAAALGRLPGAHAAGLHPLVACTDPAQAAAALVGATFAVEGDGVARRRLTQAVRALGGRAIPVSGRAKARYHAALVLASNLVVALVELATREARAAGFDDARAIAELAQGAMALVAERGTQAALTGPLVRGDLLTVQEHLATLASESRPVYVGLSRVALELAQGRGLAPAVARRLRELLRET